MASDSTPIRIAQTVGITASLFAAGANFGLSAFVVPGILESPAPLLLKQWTRMMTVGVKTVPPLAVGSGAIWLFLAWNAGQAAGTLGEKGVGTGGGSGGKVGRYILAGVLCAGIVPYTMVFLRPTNTQLYKMAEEQAKITGDALVQGLKGQTAHQLVDSWGMRNLPRAMMLLVGGALGLWTSMC